MASSGLKMLALLLMFIDHIGEYIPGMPVCLRWMGRLSAPLFVFCVVWSIDYTRDKIKYVIRLYIFSIIMGCLNYCVNTFTPFQEPYREIDNNIFRTLFLMSVILVLIERSRGNVKKRTGYIVLFIIWQIVSSMLCFLLAFLFSRDSFLEIINPILGNCISIEGRYFIILGTGMYVFKEHKLKLSLFYVMFCILYFINSLYDVVPRIIARIDFWSCIDIYGRFVDFHRRGDGVSAFMLNNTLITLFTFDYQWMMVFSLPLILLYNHEKGKGRKYFFHLFYPTHIIILYFAGNYICGR